MSDDYSPVYQGDTGSPFAPQFLHKDGTSVDLTGATITMKMQSEATGQIIVCSSISPNDWIIDDASAGKAHRQWSATDVGTLGEWTLEITISIGGKPIHTDAKELLILPVF